MKKRAAANKKKVAALEKRLTRQLRDDRRKLKARAKAAEKKADKRLKQLQDKAAAAKRKVAPGPVGTSGVEVAATAQVKPKTKTKTRAKTKAQAKTKAKTKTTAKRGRKPKLQSATK